jgi:glycosyltransferase involved in cell wall biosynthesis
MYSGNMGLPHEFDTILAAAELLREDRSILFSFVGDGSRRREVEQEVRRKGMRNVRFQKPVPLSGLSQLLASGDVHLVSMRKGLEGLVVPSKIYGILAAGRPAIMVGSTQNEIAQLLTDSKAGFVVENGRAEELAAVIRNLRDQPDVVAQMGQAGRRYYEQHLGRVRSVAAIINLLANPDSQNEKTYLGRLFSSAVPR